MLPALNRASVILVFIVKFSPLSKVKLAQLSAPTINVWLRRKLFGRPDSPSVALLLSDELKFVGGKKFPFHVAFETIIDPFTPALSIVT